MMEWLADRPVDYSKFNFENACYVELNDFRRSLCKNELEIIILEAGGYVYVLFYSTVPHFSCCKIQVSHPSTTQMHLLLSICVIFILI
jgi:hypothetical protein